MTTLVRAGIDEEPPDPGIEPVDVSQPRQLPPRVDERLLDGVLSPLAVAKDQAGDGIETITGCRREGLEGLVIAIPGCLDVVALHWPLHRVGDLDGRPITLRRRPASDRS